MLEQMTKRIALVCLAFALLVGPACAQDFSILNGEWIRSDGNYTLRVQNAHPDGSLDVTYFNPNPIHVAEANVSLWKGMVKLFVKLQDTGYPGSTYTLYYFEEKNALAGFYFQATMGQTYEVSLYRINQPINRRALRIQAITRHKEVSL